jgi:hypothetical protein
MQSSLALERWLHDVDMDPELADCIVEYVQRRGQGSMEETVQEMPRRFNTMGQSQDRIGWRRFLEGMILKEITGIQQQYYCTEWVNNESGEVILRTYHKAVRNHAWAVGLSEFHSTRSGFGYNWDSQEGRIITRD